MNKICLVIHSLQPGGTERVMSELASYFSRHKDADIHLILYGKNREIFYKIPEKVSVHTPEFSFQNRFRVWSTFRTILFLRNKIKSLSPDTILSLGEYWNSFVLLALIGLEYPVYVSDRCRPDKYLGRLHEALRSWLYPKAAGVVAQTEIAGQIYSENALNKNIGVIGNPIRKPAGIGEIEGKENIILSVGRLIETKHHDRLIRVFNKLDSKNWKLIIVGGNALKQDGMARLEKLIGDLNLENRVILTGSVTDVWHYYRKSKIFAFTSSSEGFPNVIGEAMSAGLPVVAYDCVAGPSDLIHDGENGFLIPLFDDSLFLKKLKKLMIDEGLRNNMGCAAVESVKRFSTEKSAEKFYSFILDKK